MGFVRYTVYERRTNLVPGVFRLRTDLPCEDGICKKGGLVYVEFCSYDSKTGESVYDLIETKDAVGNLFVFFENGDCEKVGSNSIMNVCFSRSGHKFRLESERFWDFLQWDEGEHKEFIDCIIKFGRKFPNTKKAYDARLFNKPGFMSLCLLVSAFLSVLPTATWEKFIPIVLLFCYMIGTETVFSIRKKSIEGDLVRQIKKHMEGCEQFVKEKKEVNRKFMAPGVFLIKKRMDTIPLGHDTDGGGFFEEGSYIFIEDVEKWQGEYKGMVEEIQDCLLNYTERYIITHLFSTKRNGSSCEGYCYKDIVFTEDSFVKDFEFCENETRRIKESMKRISEYIDNTPKSKLWWVRFRGKTKEYARKIVRDMAS